MAERALGAGTPSTDLRVVARAGVCAALLGAAVIHGSVMSEHFAQWAPAGLFFLGTELVEASLAVAAVYAWQRRVAQLVVLTSIGTVLVWLVSRTAGLPFGPAVFRLPEAIGVPDVASGLLELTAALLAVPVALGRPAAAVRRPQRPAVRRPVSGLGRALSVAVAGLAAVVMVWGLSPALTGTAHSHGHGSSSIGP